MLANGHSDGAYYLAGYAVECALKACIAKLTDQHDFPDKQRANESFTHDLERLVKAAMLGAQHQADLAADAVLEANWLTVKTWDESSRYSRHSQSEATELYNAVNDASHGVLQWAKLHW